MVINHLLTGMILQVPGDSSRALFIPYLEVTCPTFEFGSRFHHPFKRATIAELPGTHVFVEQKKPSGKMFTSNPFASCQAFTI